MLLEKSTEFNYLRINTLSWKELKSIEDMLSNPKCTFDGLVRNSTSKKLMDSIALANPNFFNFIKKQKALNPKIRSTIYKYCIRSVTKAVPLFGFSSVSSNNAATAYHIDIDSKWLHDYISQNFPISYLLKKMREQVKLSMNQNYLYDNQEYYYSFNNEGDGRKIIKTSPELEAIVLELKNPITVKKLISKLTDTYQLHIDDAEEILSQLIKQKIIIWEFNSKFKSNFQKLLYISEWGSTEVKKKISFVLEKMDSLRHNFSVKEYLTLQNYMSTLIDNNNCDNALNVVSTQAINTLFKQDNSVFEFINWIESNFFINSNADVIDYFIDRFGQNTFVPLSKVLNDDRFLNLYFSHSKKFITKSNKLEKELIKLFETRLISDSKEINLQDYQDKFDLNVKTKNSDVWTAGELIFDAFYSSHGQLKDVCLNPQIGSNTLGNLGGRFYSYIGMEERVLNYFDSLSKSNSYEFVKVIYNYPDPKSENVDSHLEVPKYICLNKLITTSNDKYISIKDTGLLVENKHIFLFDINAQKKIAITNLNSLNPQNGNLLLQLICYVGEQNELIQKIEYLKNIHDKVAPELTVKWGNITLFPAIIKFNKDTILGKLKDSKANELMVFLNSKLNVESSSFLFSCGDESEYVDFLNTISVRSLIDTLSQATQETVSFRTVNHRENGYTSQFVMGYDNKKYANSLDLKIKNIIPKRLDFNQVLYFKIYVHDYLEDKYIKNNLSKMIFQLKNNFSNYNGSFFIRYKEMEHHIRLRIFLKNKDRAAIEQYVVDTLESDSLVDKIEICSFFPETSRYGGNKGWNYYSECLKQESDLLLSLTNHNNLASALYLGLNIIKIFKADKHVKRNISGFVASQQIKSDIRENKKKIIDQIKTINELISSSGELAALYKDWLAELELYKAYIQTLPLYDQFYILDSIIHMLCNRSFGISKQAEKKFWLYLNSVLGYCKYSGEKSCFLPIY